jgi:hypothetical protein
VLRYWKQDNYLWGSGISFKFWNFSINSRNIQNIFVFFRVPTWCILNVGTVPMWCILNIGTVPTWCILNVGTVPTFNLSQLFNVLFFFRIINMLTYLMFVLKKVNYMFSMLCMNILFIQFQIHCIYILQYSTIIWYNITCKYISNLYCASLFNKS